MQLFEQNVFMIYTASRHDFHTLCWWQSYIRGGWGLFLSVMPCFCTFRSSFVWWWS